MRSLSFITLILLLMPASCQRPSNEDPVRDLAENFVHESLALSARMPVVSD